MFFLEVLLFIGFTLWFILTVSDDPYLFSAIFMNWLCGMIATLQDWQPLIAGLLAVVAAICTIIVMRQQIKTSENQHKEQIEVIRKQIKTTEKQYNDRLARKEISARARMIGAISGLTQYAKECYLYIQDESQQSDLPIPNPIHIDAINKYIEYADKKTLNEIYNLISFYQIFNSRLKSFRTSDIASKNEHMLYDVVKFTALVLDKFQHARNEKQQKRNTEPNLHDMNSALKTLIDKYYMNDSGYNEVSKIIKKHYE